MFLIFDHYIFEYDFVEKSDGNTFDTDVCMVLIRQMFSDSPNKISLHFRALNNEVATKKQDKYRA